MIELLTANTPNGKKISINNSRIGKVFNPATGEQIAEVELASKDTVNLAVESSQKAFLKWSKTTPIARARIFSKYKDWKGAAALFSSVINRLRFENYISWGADTDEEYYACGEYLNPAFFNHTAPRKDCAFIMLHYTNDETAIQNRHKKFLDVVNQSIINNEETYVESFITDPNIITQWKNTSNRRRMSSLEKTFPKETIYRFKSSFCSFRSSLLYFLLKFSITVLKTNLSTWGISFALTAFPGLATMAPMRLLSSRTRCLTDILSENNCDMVAKCL